VLGPAGSGKSRLTADAVDEARRLGLGVLAGACRQHELDQPLAVFGELFDPGALDVRPAGGRGVLEAGAPSDPGLSMADRVVDLVGAMAARRPVLVVVDDAQWADPGTVRALRLLAARAPSSGVAVVVGCRPPVAGSALARELAAWRDDRHGPEVVELGPLPSPDVVELAAAALGARIGRGLALVLEGAGGNPLLVEATLEALAASLSTVGDVVDTPPGTVLRPGSVVERLIDALSPEVRSVVQVFAVLGHGATVDLAASLCGRPAIEVVAALDEAVAAGVLRSDPSGHAFRHDLFRDGALASIPPGGRAALHLAAARLLVAEGGDDLEIAEHFLLGARPGDRVAIAWLRDAARRRIRRAPGTALRLVDAAIALDPEPDHGLLVTRFEALAGSGRASEAEALGRVLLHDTVDPVDRARLHRELALSMFVQGQAARACEEMGAAVTLLAGREGHERAVAERSLAYLLALDLPRAVELAEQARSLGADANAQVAAEAVLTVASVFVADLRGASVHAARMLEHAERWRANESHQYQPWFCAGLVAAETDDLAEVERLTRLGRDVAVRSGSGWAVPAYDGLAAFAALRSGHLGDAEAFSLAALDYSDEVDSFGILVWCHAFVAQVALAQGDLERSRRHTAAAEAILATGRTGFGLDHIAMCRSYLAEAGGDTAGALAGLEELWAGFTLLSLPMPRQWIGPRLARLAVLEGRLDLADDVVRGLTETADRTNLPTQRADALVAMAWRTGEPAAAFEAATVLRPSPRRFQRAEALAAAAVLAARHGARTDASAAALAAAELFEAVGATALAEAAARLAPVRGGRRPRPATGFDALTKSERAVVALVAEGLGNDAIASRLYLSRRTVESHVSAAYRKLGVSTRVELALAVRSAAVG